MAGILQRWLNKSLLKKYDRVSIPVTDLHDNADYQMGAFELGQVVASNPDIGTLDRIYGVATNLDEGGDYNIDNLKEPGRYTWTTKVPGGIAIEGRTTENNKYGSLTVTKVGSGNDRKQVLNFGIDNTQYSRTNPGGNNPWGKFKNADLALQVKDGATFSPSGDKIALQKSKYKELTKKAWYRILSYDEDYEENFILTISKSYSYYTPETINVLITSVPDGINVITLNTSGIGFLKELRVSKIDGNYVFDIYINIEVPEPYSNYYLTAITPLGRNANRLKVVDYEKIITQPTEEQIKRSITFSSLTPMAINGVSIPDINGTIEKAKFNKINLFHKDDNVQIHKMVNTGFYYLQQCTDWDGIIYDEVFLINIYLGDYNTLQIMQPSTQNGKIYYRRSFGTLYFNKIPWLELVKTPTQTLQTYNKGITE